jgi:hypothetical protein
MLPTSPGQVLSADEPTPAELKMMPWCPKASAKCCRSPLLPTLLALLTFLGARGEVTLAANHAGDAPPQVAVGVVFDDGNRNGVRDAGEAGLPQVRVSNGQDIVRTDSEGRYRLPISDDTIIFVIKPRGWMTPVSENQLPRFFYNHKPAGSPPAKSPYPGVAPTGPLPASVDFALCRHDEPDRFEALVLGDTQPADIQDVAFLAHDIVEELIGTPAALGISLGDLVSDNLSLYEPVTQVIGRLGVPWYNVPGNHDRNYFATEPRYFDESFERVFGPSHYAFQYGGVHFLVLNDVVATGDEKYVGGLGDVQLDFVQNYLADTPPHELVVLMMHIPIGEWPEAERKRVFGLLEPRPHNLVLAAHYHYQEHVFLGAKEAWSGSQPLHELINVTACGSWWTGMPDDVGLPATAMRDGTPNGYSVVTFDKNTYSIRFKAARRPADYQMNIFAPDEIAPTAESEAEVLVNVFAGSPRSMVEMQLDGGGAWLPLEQTRGPDPFYAAARKLFDNPNPPPGKKLPKPIDSPHLWRGVLPASLASGTHLIHVRTTDMFGQAYHGYRIIRVRAGETSAAKP